MNEFKNGLKDGIPIALGYFAVSFSFGILAKKHSHSTMYLLKRTRCYIFYIAIKIHIPPCIY